MHVQSCRVYQITAQEFQSFLPENGQDGTETEPSLLTWMEKMRRCKNQQACDIHRGPRGHRGLLTSEKGTELNNATKNTLPSSPKDDTALERKLHQNKSTS